MAEHSSFTEIERNILRIAQKNIPDSTTPYADIAKEAGTDEETVLGLLRRLKEDGSIRRFGASIKHQRAGFSHNAMVAWKVKDLAEADIAGPLAAKHPLISHCYYRPSSAADWPYTIYTMIHGRHETEYLEVVEWVLQNTPLKEYAVLESIRELKKISMTYF
ncbi:winged helix-turn-helix transcriptional regulator [Desulfovibrio sp. OttesenSCG-928-C06]|nr:winged helix-turn-helix transcriptional regulator [Desulfovibrio sp. OttesenSCG-928-C06]